MAKVTITIPAYNCENTLDETVKSVLNQTYKDWELFIIDDGSKDSTYSIAKAYQNLAPSKIKAYRQPNKGPAAARNNGFRRATGTSQYFIWIDADDLWEKNRLKTMVEFLKNNRDIDIVSTDALIFKNDIKKAKTRYFSQFKNIKEYDFDNILSTGFIFTSSLFRRSVFEKTKGLKEDRYLIGIEDYEFWINALFNGAKFQMIRRPLAYYRQTQGSLSSKILNTNYSLEEMFKNILKWRGLNENQINTINQRLVGIRLFIAQELAKDGETKKAIRYFKKVDNKWSKLSISLLEKNSRIIWLILFGLKNMIGKVK